MICPYCKKEINRKKLILRLLKNKEYSLGELAKKLLVTPSSTHSLIKELKKENKIIIERFGGGKKIKINLK